MHGAAVLGGRRQQRPAVDVQRALLGALAQATHELEVRVLREKGSGKLLGTGNCCNTENKVLSASVCGQSVRSASHLRATLRYARLRLKLPSDRQVSS